MEKKRYGWGGNRKGIGKPVGRPKGSKSSQKVKFLGFLMFEEEKQAIKAGAQAEGITPTLFVIKHSVLAVYDQARRKNMSQVYTLNGQCVYDCDECGSSEIWQGSPCPVCDKPKMKITFMNVPLMTVAGKFKMTELSIEEAKALCQQADEFGSAVGHSGAADAITSLLHIECQVNRIQYEQPVGEHVISIKLLSRMPEGYGNLTKEIMDEIGFKFYHVERLA
jgi:hypothetical protein